MNDENIASALSRQIRARREALELTQKELAQLAGVSYQTIGAIETGRWHSSRRLDKIANALGLPLDRLMIEAGEISASCLPEISRLVRMFMKLRDVDETELSKLMRCDPSDVRRLVEGDVVPLLWGAAAAALEIPLESLYDVATGEI